jgi:hypothetical protein
VFNSGKDNGQEDWEWNQALSAPFQAFVASLQVVSVPKDWKAAKLDPRWCNAMMEELEVLRKK